MIKRDRTSRLGREKGMRSWMNARTTSFSLIVDPDTGSTLRDGLHVSDYVLMPEDAPPTRPVLTVALSVLLCVGVVRR